MKHIPITFLALLVVTAPQSFAQDFWALRTTTYPLGGDALKASHPNWMNGLPDSMRISELSIPGTHDTGTEVRNNADVGAAYSHCQDATVYNQLLAGVRFLDLRVDLKNGIWTLHHSGFFYRPLTSVLGEVSLFLTLNPSETVLCRLTADTVYNEAGLPVAAKLESFLNNYPVILERYPKIWQRPDTFRADGVTPTLYGDEATGEGFGDDKLGNTSFYWPTLGEVRGKMVMFVQPNYHVWQGQGLSSGLAYLPNSAPVSFPLNTNSLFRLQTLDDFNRTDYGFKQTQDFAHIAIASTNKSKTFLYATGLNIGATASTTPVEHAEVMNRYLLNKLNSIPDLFKKTGIVLMDFPGPGLLSSMIALNFRHNTSASSVYPSFYTYAEQLPFEKNLNFEYQPGWQARSWRRLVKERIPSTEFNTFIAKADDISSFTHTISTSDSNTLSVAVGPLSGGWETETIGVLFQSHNLPPAAGYTTNLVKVVLDGLLTLGFTPAQVKFYFDTYYPLHEWTVFNYASEATTVEEWPYFGTDFNTDVVWADNAFWNGALYARTIVAGSRKPDLVSTNESSRSVVGHWEFPFPDALVGNNLGSGLINFWGVGVVPESTPGIEMSHGDLPNGGPSAIRMHQWTLVMDLLLEPDSGYRSLLQIDSLDNSTDGDVFINGAGGIGTKSQYYGTVSVGSWHRVVVAVDATQEQLMSLYIDGSKVGEIPTRTFTATGDVTAGYVYSNVDRWSLQDKALLFGDDNGESGDMYVGGIQLRNYKMSDEEIAGLGGVASQADIIANPDGKLFIERADMPELQVNTNGFQRMVKVPDQLKLTWKPGGVLQSSDDLSAPFSDVPDVRSSSTYYPASGPASNAVRQFFRLRP